MKMNGCIGDGNPGEVKEVTTGAEGIFISREVTTRPIA